jgi:hypothetical protein
MNSGRLRCVYINERDVIIPHDISRSLGRIQVKQLSTLPSLSMLVKKREPDQIIAAV